MDLVAQDTEQGDWLAFEGFGEDGVQVFIPDDPEYQVPTVFWRGQTDYKQLVSLVTVTAKLFEKLDLPFDPVAKLVGMENLPDGDFQKISFEFDALQSFADQVALNHQRKSLCFLRADFLEVVEKERLRLLPDWPKVENEQTDDIRSSVFSIWGAISDSSSRNENDEEIGILLPQLILRSEYQDWLAEVIVKTSSTGLVLSDVREMLRDIDGYFDYTHAPEVVFG